MRYSIYTLVAAASMASAQSATSAFTPAPQVTTNPVGAEFVAELPEQEKNDIRGSVVAKSNPDGKGVKFAVSISGFPAEGGPFMYHIHKAPVPADGNCTGALSHLDPYARGEVPACNPETKEFCEVGDLSGKWGNFTEDGSFEYVDLYASTDPADVAYFGDLSIVVHANDKARLSCANFTVISPGGSPTASYPVSVPAGTGYPTGYPHPSGTGSHPGHESVVPTSVHSPNPTQPAPPAEQTVNAGDRLSVAGLGVVAGAMALFL